MASFNKVLLIGNLTRDPEIRVTPNGKSVAQFGLAVNRKYKDEAGNPHDDVTFLDIEAWGKQAELCQQYLKKGNPVFIEGRLKFEQWEDKQSGQKRSKLKVVLENMQFLARKDDSSADEPGAAGRADPPAARPAPPPPPARAQPPAVDDDVPF